jgi:hypothetical protein
LMPPSIAAIAAIASTACFENASRSIRLIACQNPLVPGSIRSYTLSGCSRPQVQRNVKGILPAATSAARLTLLSSGPFRPFQFREKSGSVHRLPFLVSTEGSTFVGWCVPKWSQLPRTPPNGKLVFPRVGTLPIAP